MHVLKQYGIPVLLPTNEFILTAAIIKVLTALVAKCAKRRL